MGLIKMAILSNLIPYVIIVCVGFLSYSNSFTVPFIFDDIRGIAQNYLLHDIRNISEIWHLNHSRFLTNLSFALNYHLGGENVIGYHLVNLLIHLSTAFFVFWLVRLVLKLSNLKLPDKIYKLIIPLVSSLIFVAHPTQTQAVTYISQRTTSLAAMFYLASLVFYLQSTISFRFLYFLVSLGLGVLALLTKENTYTLPIAVALIDFFFINQPKKQFKQRLWRLLPFFLISFIVILFIRIFPAKPSIKIEDLGYLTSAEHTGVINRAEYLLTQANVIRTYLRLFFLPVKQNFDYDHPIARTFFEPPTFLSFIFLFSVMLLAILIFRSNRLISFGIFFFFITLLVESSIFPLPDVIFEHRLYLPSIGIIISLVGASVWFLERSKSNLAIYQRILILSLIAVITTLGFFTYQRNKIWHDEVTLWTDVVKKSPQKARPHTYLGVVLAKQGKIDEAIAEFNTAIKLNPRYVYAYNNLGIVYKQQGDLKSAEELFLKSRQLNSQIPETYYLLAIIYLNQNKLAEAENAFNQTLSLDPFYPQAYNNLGVIYAKQNNIDKAAWAFKKALEINPDYQEAKNNLQKIHQL